METFVSPADYTRQLATARRNHDLHWCHIEPHLSLTGANADERLVIQPASEPALLLWLLHGLTDDRGLARQLPPQIRSALPEISLERTTRVTGLNPAQLQNLTDALSKARRPLLIVGGIATAQHAGQQTGLLGGLLQWALADPWQGLDFSRAQRMDKVGDLRDLERLNQTLQRDTAGVLLISRADPLRHAPPGWNLPENLRRASLSVALTDLPNVTSQTVDLVLPLTHGLELWDDAEPRYGLHSLIQPAIAPLYATLCEGDILLQLQKRITGQSDAGNYEGFLQQRWRKQFSTTELRSFLKDGHVMTAPSRDSFTLRIEQAASALKKTVLPVPLPAPVVIITGSIRSFDGRSAALPLLGEVPDPLTTITHGTWIALSQHTAHILGISDSGEVRLTSGDFDLTQPARLQPACQTEFSVYRSTV